MFCGIIKAKGQVIKQCPVSNQIHIHSPWFLENPVEQGASIAVDGVCLTAEHAHQETVEFSLGQETLKVTLMGQKQPGDLVHLEPALLPTTKIDGHFVQGHVDAIAKLVNKQWLKENLLLTLEVSSSLKNYLVPKGSVALNGVSLTINQVEHNCFTVCLVPYTLRETNFSNLNIGDSLHVETDIIGRYIVNALNQRQDLNP